jgi:hypothetical protein
MNQDYRFTCAAGVILDAMLLPAVAFFIERLQWACAVTHSHQTPKGMNASACRWAAGEYAPRAEYAPGACV